MGVSDSSQKSLKANGPSNGSKPGSKHVGWTKESAAKLQAAVDLIFGTAAAGTSLYGLEFSFSIADPQMEGCPLIGCSTGFTKLCGYELDEIVGHNCRFLVDPVPPEQTDKKMRQHTKEFCAAIARGDSYQIPPSDCEPWMPQDRPSDELFALQRNARKDGSFFNNMFLMKAFEMSTDLGMEKPYIIALQSELPQGKQDVKKLAQSIEELDAKMAKVENELTGLFFMKCSISRQAHRKPSASGASPSGFKLMRKSLCESVCGRNGPAIGEPLNRPTKMGRNVTTTAERRDPQNRSPTAERRRSQNQSQEKGPAFFRIFTSQLTQHPAPAADSPARTRLTSPISPVTPTNVWTQKSADKLQGAVDLIFGTAAAGTSLYGLEFSFSIADPEMEGCPLIGCSTGFTKLCGYELDEIVGHNCRFLVDPVPPEQTDKKMRKHTKEFCAAIGRGETYEIPPSEYEEWMPKGRPSDEFFALQRNARKDGSLFNNMFLMKAFEISTDLGKEKPYIIALQSELPQGYQDLEKLAKSIDELDVKMAKVNKVLTSLFFVNCLISRQPHYAPFAFQKDGVLQSRGTSLQSPRGSLDSRLSSPALEGQTSRDPGAPQDLSAAFHDSEVKPWAQSGFTTVRKLASASRNQGEVRLMQDKAGQQLAVKVMPNSWMQLNHEEFLRVHPRQTELPWQDIGCVRYLNTKKYKYVCDLVGVFRDEKDTYVASSCAAGGDLFDAAQVGDSPSPKREATFAPLVFDIFTALQHLHNMGIVHRDISLENVLLWSKDDFSQSIRLIDFGMCSSGRTFRNAPRGKASYEAPEMQGDAEYDAFLTDGFAAGVLAYALLLKDYPWLSTKPGQDKRFEFIQKNGLRAYCTNARVRGSQKTIASCASEELMCLLEGILMISPEKRLTLGENSWTKRKSVFDQAWMNPFFHK